MIGVPGLASNMSCTDLEVSGDTILMFAFAQAGSISLDGTAIPKKSTLASKGVLPSFGFCTFTAASTPANSTASCVSGLPNSKLR